MEEISDWSPGRAFYEHGVGAPGSWLLRRKYAPRSARCPKCGAKMPVPEPAKATTCCPHCGTLWKHKSGVKGVLGEFEETEEVIEPGEVDLTDEEAEETWGREHQ